MTPPEAAGFGVVAGGRVAFGTGGLPPPTAGLDANTGLVPVAIGGFGLAAPIPVAEGTAGLVVLPFEVTAAGVGTGLRAGGGGAGAAFGFGGTSSR